MDDLYELCEIVGHYPDDVGGWDEWFSTLEYDDRCTAWDFVSWVLEEDLDSARKKFDPTNIDDLDDLKEKVESTVYTFLTQDPMVNFDDDFVKEYSAIEVTNTDDSRVRVEVRADISFDNPMRLAEKLNKIVTKIDKKSYFDAVEPGILDAYIEV